MNHSHTFHVYNLRLWYGFLLLLTTIIAILMITAFLHQFSDTKRNPWVVMYWQCPTNDSCNSSICSCLPCNYVTKPFGILMRVIKSQRVFMSRPIFLRKNASKYLQISTLINWDWVFGDVSTQSFLIPAVTMRNRRKARRKCFKYIFENPLINLLAPW